jgi:hypothetical protein
MKILRSVPIIRVVAAADVTAGPAQSQVYPAIAELEALRATATTWTVGSHKV